MTTNVISYDFRKNAKAIHNTIMNSKGITYVDCYINGALELCWPNTTQGRNAKPIIELDDDR